MPRWQELADERPIFRDERVGQWTVSVDPLIELSENRHAVDLDEGFGADRFNPIRSVDTLASTWLGWRWFRVAEVVPRIRDQRRQYCSVVTRCINDEPATVDPSKVRASLAKVQFGTVPERERRHRSPLSSEGR